MPEVEKADKSKALKATLNLPKTDFAMKANLPVNEPEDITVPRPRRWSRISPGSPR